MNNSEKYKNVFIEVFGLNDSNVVKAEFQHGQWDSVGHMSLISALEETFDIYFEATDMMSVTSYEAGKEVLKRYGVEV